MRGGRSVWRGLRGVAWHPLLFAAWPVLFLYAHNVDETPLREAGSLLTVVVGSTALLYAALALLFRDVRRAALLTTVVVLAVLLFGHVRELLADPGWLLPAWLAAAATLAAVSSRARRSLPEITTILSGVAVVLVALPMFDIAQTSAPAVAAGGGSAFGSDLEERVGEWSQGGEPRDIYYLVFDRYASAKGLRDRFGFDNSAFMSALEDRGFYVAGDSVGNHLRTAQSLASSLNLRYLNRLAAGYREDESSLLPIYELLQDHELGRLLRRRGYTYVHIGAWWDPTQTSRQADVNLGFERRSDFQLRWWDSTLLSEIANPRERTGDQRRRAAYEGSLTQFRQLRSAAERPGPTFTLAHVLLPHQPFVFDLDGDFVDLAEDAERGHDRGYLEQLQYTNRLIEGLLDDLLDVPPERQPIIVIQADEGPHPLRFLADEDAFNWEEATTAELREKFRILNAYYLPGVQQRGLYPAISPVNTWRLILDRYFAADLPLLPDRSYIFRDNAHPYDLTEVTRRLR